MSANQHQTYRLLQCLTVARRPLRVEELAEILALDFDECKEGIPELKEDWRWKDQQEAVMTTCSSLVSVVNDGHHRVVQFSHFSVKEFLTSDRLASSPDVSYFHIPPEPAHTVITKACLGILLRSNKSAGDANAKSDSPLAEYAAEHWVGHAQFGEVSTSVEDGMRRLFDPSEPQFAAWIELYNIDRPWWNFVRNQVMQRGSPLYYASFCGFRGLVAHLIEEHPQHLNAQAGLNRSPLVAALLKKHFHTAHLLYQRGAKLDIRGIDNITPLHAASHDGFIGIAQWLLAHGGDPNSRNDRGQTPLHYAAKNGQIESVRMLLRHGADANTKYKNNRTPLALASLHLHHEIVSLLLQHGADVAMQDLRHNTPLRLALVSDKYTRPLLPHRAHVKDQMSGRPYIKENPNAKAKTVQILLEHGAGVTAWDDTHSTPLHLASSWDIPEIVRLLIKHGADVNALDGNNKMPLHLASARVSVKTATFVTAQGSVHTSVTQRVKLSRYCSSTARTWP